MICSICSRVSAGGDHLDCLQKRRVELEDEERKLRLPEALDMANGGDLHVEIRAMLEHMAEDRD